MRSESALVRMKRLIQRVSSGSHVSEVLTSDNQDKVDLMSEVGGDVLELALQSDGSSIRSTQQSALNL